jgi:hypothetical protein
MDDISFKLGEVTAGLTLLTQHFEKQDQKLDGLGASVDEIKDQLKPVTGDIHWMKPQVRSYQRVRWLGGIVVACLGVIGGSLGDWFIKKITGA